MRAFRQPNLNLLLIGLQCSSDHRQHVIANVGGWRLAQQQTHVLQKYQHHLQNIVSFCAVTFAFLARKFNSKRCNQVFEALFRNGTFDLPSTAVTISGLYRLTTKSRSKLTDHLKLIFWRLVKEIFFNQYQPTLRIWALTLACIQTW